MVDESRIGGYGPFKPESRELILKELFLVEKSMFEKYQKRIIRFEELLSIQKIWDRKNLKNSKGKRLSIKRLWNDVYNKNEKSPIKDIDEEMLLAEFCKKNDVPYDMIKNMIIDERDLSKYSRRKNIFIRLINI